MTDAAIQVMNCVRELRQRFGISVVVGTLRGRDNAKLRSYGLEKCACYGKLEHLGEETIKNIINLLLQEDLLRTTLDKYSLLKFTPAGYDLLDKYNASLAGTDGAEPVRIMLCSLKQEEEERGSERRKSGKNRRSDVLTSKGLELFDNLRNLRSELAREEGIPPYIVFADKTLLDMCLKLPLNKEEMLAVSGVGENKYMRYGQQFLQVIQDFTGGRKEKLFYGELEEGAPFGGKPKRESRKRVKEEFTLTREQAEYFPYQEKYLATELAEALMSLVDSESMKKLTGKAILSYVQEQGLAEEQYIDGRRTKVVSDEGRRYGLEIGPRTSRQGTTYDDLYFKEDAQRMILEHFIAEDDFL